MKSKIKTIILLFLCIFLISGAAFAVERYLLVAPGETFDPTTGHSKNGTPTVQIAGFPFNMMVDAVYDTSYAYVNNSLENTYLYSTPLTSTYNPSVPFLLQDNNVTPPVSSCKRSVTITVNASAAGSVIFYATPVTSGGTRYNSVTITVQKISTLVFNTLPAAQTAGISFAFTLTAMQANLSPATGFNGSAASVTISAVYSPGYSVPVAVATFANGVATGNITLYDSTENPQRVTLSASVTLPTGVPAGLSTNFIVNTQAVASKLVLIGPGQSINPGVNGGNGRLAMSETTTTVAAGVPFSVTVYAVDAFWNTVTGATGTVILSSADPMATTPPAATLNQGKAIMTVKMGTVSAATALTATSSTGYTQDVDNIPVIHGLVDHFDFTSYISDKTAHELFTVYAVAHDAANNVVTDFNSAVALQAIKGGSTPLVDSHWYADYFNPVFINGYLNGATGDSVRITEKTTNCQLTLTYDSIVNTSNSFAVNPAAFTRLLVKAQGETLAPGANWPADTGKSGVPDAATAGSIVGPFTVYGTDAYNNIVTTAGDSFDVSSSDPLGSANPVRVTLAGGVGSFNFQFMSSGYRGVYCNDVTNINILPATVTVQVQGASISYFDFTGIIGSQTAGATTNPVVRAMDAYGNFISNYTGHAWVSCPDTDWVLPSETTINMTSATLYGAAWYVTFTAGTGAVLTNMSFRRAGTARIFVCDDASGTTYNAIGHAGLSTPITVSPGSIIKQLQIVPPGMTSRPGTTDGLDGSPRGQIVGDVFTVTVNACDDYWNIITTAGTGWNDTIRLVTSDNGNAIAGKSGGALSTPPVTASMNGGPGYVLMDVSYGQEQANFYISVHDQSRGSVLDNQSPFINIFNVDHFRIRYANSDIIPDQTVDTYFTVTIQAEDASFNRITSFDGASVELREVQAESDALFTLIPTSVTFTAGFAIVQVKMFKAANSTQGSSAIIKASYGSKTGVSNSFNLWWGTPAYVITLAPGMTHKPGLVQTGWKLLKNGCIGDPLPVKAGDTFSVTVIYCDAQFNRICDYPATTCKLTSSDPLATLGLSPELPLAADNVLVNINAGIYISGSSMKLRTVGPDRTQTINSVPQSGSWITVFPTEKIPIVHATLDHFGISAPPASAPQVAGVPFNITIQALDAWGNICDDGVVAYAVPFNNSVNLLPSTLANTMYPYVYTLSNGQAVASVRLFKAPDSDVHINASYGAITGTSNQMATASNEFKRLLVIDSGYGGMVQVNGRFTGAVPAEGAFPMVTGAPFAADISQAKVSYSNGGIPHFGKIHPFTVYACDAYGNVTFTPELAGNTVTVTFNDAFGQPVTPTTIDTGNGFSDIDLIFHSAKDGMYVNAHTTQPGIADYTTPTFTTMAGPAYGMQLLVPGLAAVEGSGNTNASFFNWYNGVTGIASAEFTTQPFPVIVQAADIFGNFQSTVPSNPFRVYTSSTQYINPYPASFPTNIVNFVGSINDSSPGRSTFTAMYDVSLARDVDLKPQDLTAPGPSSLERVWIEYPNVPIVMSGNLEYQIIVKGIDYGSDGTNSVDAVVLDAFALTVNVVDSVSKKPVYGVNAMFKLVPVFAADINTPTGVPVTVPLGGTGNVVNGVYTTILETYSRADLIRIRVEDPNTVPVVTTGHRYSCIIDFGANSLSANMTAAAVPPSIGSGQISQIRAQVIDAGGNSVSGREVEFEFLNTDPESTGAGAFGSLGTPLLVTRTVTNLQGVAVANFYGGYINGKCKIRVRYFGAGAPQESILFVNVSLVDPNVAKISNYPNPFAAGTESTNISFYVENPVEVKLKIYNLLGQLVLEKAYTQAEVTGLIASSGNMLSYIWDGSNAKGKIVGNGGYIAAVEAGQVKYKRKIAVRK